MKKEKYFPPELEKKQFHCPHCEVFAKQRWVRFSEITRGDNSQVSQRLNQYWKISKCEHCGEAIIWDNNNMIYPKTMIVESPNDDLSEDIKKDYLEAATILNDSPRASAALLRLALQKLCKQLGEKGEDINHDIRNLVKKGLNSEVQKSLDLLRIVGNNAVHPGVINIEEKRELVLKLFRLINFIAEKMITEPKELKSLYEEELPESAKEQIKKRDNQI